ncbi:hypothetical protein DM872_29745 [Pseudomonas taiwanensis]|uniref:gamma-mobile-trio integrase GmtZ n=1 Tax=Pseudomonas taiwanensis TaxID=470150 RepID=UPI0015C0AF79|nr:VPA1269 family protein [Pseudomonas taiwanensis]NWL81041.1 hypothetical protein [Pseudomonas taiwanensis]
MNQKIATSLIDGLYLSFEEASRAAQSLGFKNARAYKAGYKKNPRLPKTPKQQYPDEWCGWPMFLGSGVRPARYATLAEASAAAIRLNITSSMDYSGKYKNDPRLRASPEVVYPDWIGWRNFLGKPEWDFYSEIELASNAALSLGIRTCYEYGERHIEDLRLPANPEKYYKDWAGWPKFLKKLSNKYPTLAEASAAARRLGAKSTLEYIRLYKLDSGLRSNPALSYPEEWVNWYDFLGMETPVEKYKDLESAMCAVRALGVTKKAQYRRALKIDKRLPWNPQDVYLEEWAGWSAYLGVLETEQVYNIFEEAKSAVERLGITSWREYCERRSADPRLPRNPRLKYPKEWKGPSDFFSVSTRREEIYLTLGEARAAVQKLPIHSRRDYETMYMQDRGLPGSPQQKYVHEWKGWLDFLLPVEYRCLADLRRACKILKLGSAREYREEYKKHPPMPANPDRFFRGEWVDWFDLLGLVTFLSYKDACAFIRSSELKSKKAYINFIDSNRCDFLPRTPDQVYAGDWVSWNEYLGKSEPFTIDNIVERYSEWRDAIVDLMRKARGGFSKKKCLCMFVRLFIQKNELGISPVDFILNGKCNAREFKEFLESEFPERYRRPVWLAVNELIEHVILTRLTIEDEVTGELVSVPGARNPIASSGVVPEYVGSGLGESCKPALAYQYVDDMKNWMIPPSAKNFSDLQHLHIFDADWVEVDMSRTFTDENDADCVLKMSGGKLMIWSPICWIQTFALASVPARGVQIAYNDSGEGDKYFPEVVQDRLVWVENFSEFAGLTEAQGFVKRYPNDQFGMHFTTNKTGSIEKGYNVAWIPMSLAYWLVKLRKWQSKYNPVKRPLPWVECKKTNFNEAQLKAKGANFFLFRGVGSEEPLGFSEKLSARLAAALYYSQPESLKLAELSGAPGSLSKYSSRYTPHSMRVSLITAYIMEFGLPVEIVMKIVGHSSIVVTIYYCKIGVEEFRSRLEKAEKEALKNKAYAAQMMIEQGRIDELKPGLIATDGGLIEALSGNVPAGNYLFRDYGFCPYAGTRCEDGGPLSNNPQVRFPVPYGYLGCQNCLRCRHFVTGPAFIGGLVSVLNEISLNVRVQYEAYSGLEEKVAGILIEIDTLDEEEYQAVARGSVFDSSIRDELEVRLRKLRSESESAAKKLDMFMCDMQAGARLLMQCDGLVGQQVESCDGEIHTQLVVQSGHELDVAFEEVSYFHQLCEVCSNAEIYESSSSSLAVATRSQFLDRMMSYNKIPTFFYSLSQEQQLVVGNQVAQLLVSRVRSWERIDDLVDGRLLFADLLDSERIEKVEIDVILADSLRSSEGVVYALGSDSSEP